MSFVLVIADHNHNIQICDDLCSAYLIIDCKIKSNAKSDIRDKRVYKN